MFDWKPPVIGEIHAYSQATSHLMRIGPYADLPHRYHATVTWVMGPQDTAYLMGLALEPGHRYHPSMRDAIERNLAAWGARRAVWERMEADGTMRDQEWVIRGSGRRVYL